MAISVVARGELVNFIKCNCCRCQQRATEENSVDLGLGLGLGVVWKKKEGNVNNLDHD